MLSAMMAWRWSVAFVLLVACGDDVREDPDARVDTSCEGGCTTPPESFCPGDGTMAMFESPGTCNGGTCEYLRVAIPCPMCPVCDPCEGVVCDTAPPPDCDGDAVRSYAAPGTCADGSCEYPATTAPCPDGCADGACL